MNKLALLFAVATNPASGVPSGATGAGGQGFSFQELAAFLTVLGMLYASASVFFARSKTKWKWYKDRTRAKKSLVDISMLWLITLLACAILYGLQWQKLIKQGSLGYWGVGLCFVVSLHVLFLLAVRRREQEARSVPIEQGASPPPHSEVEGNSWICRTRNAVACIRDECVPPIKNPTLKILIPARNHMHVDEHNYSEEFTTALPAMNEERKWRDFLNERIAKDGSLNLTELPRVFLVCAYPPLRIIEAVLQRLLAGPLTPGDKIGLDGDILDHFKSKGYADAEAALRSGLWRKDSNEGNVELGFLVRATRALFPHFEQVRVRHATLKKALEQLIRADTPPTVAKQLNDYSDDCAIVRLLIQRKGDKLHPDDVKDVNERRALEQAWKLYWRLNGTTTCYLADVEAISKRVPDGTLLPYTDFAIVKNVNNDRAVEVWDFYGESHLLITHGRPKHCMINGDVTPYEQLMEDWQRNHHPAGRENGYERISQPHIEAEELVGVK